MFYEQMRYFRTPKFAVRGLNGRPPSQWRTEARLVRPARDRPHSIHVLPEDPPIDDPARPGTKPHSQEPSEAGTSHFSASLPNAVFRRADSIDRSSHSMAISPDTNKDQKVVLPRLYRQGVKTHSGGPIRQQEPIRGIAVKPQIPKSIGKQARITVRNRLTASPRQPERDVTYFERGQVAALPTVASTESKRATLPNRNTEHMDISRGVDRASAKAISIGRNDAGVRERMTTSDTRSQKAAANSGAFLNEHVQSVAKIQGAPIRQAATENVSLGPIDFGSRTPSPTRLRDNKTSAVQSLDVVGELWLDTLALRDWLRVYLTDEIGRASRATNRTGASFENA
jgi:hypothetical protein